MKIDCLVNSLSFELIEPLIKDFKNISTHVAKQTKQKNKLLFFTVVFVTNKEIKEINKVRRGIDEVTDVLSFPLLNIKGGTIITKQEFFSDYDLSAKAINLGDIFISLDKAKSQAEEYGHSVEREVGYLFVHGLLHLLGFDHIDEGDKNQMRAVEELVLKKCKLER